MMKSGVLVATLLVGLVACTPRVVPTVQGIGFDSPQARAIRDAQLAAATPSIIPEPQVNTIPSQEPREIVDVPVAIPTVELQAAGIGVAAPAPAPAPAPATPSTPSTPAPQPNLGPDPLRVLGLDASPDNPAPQIIGGVGLSDEQNFDAVSERETIESDAMRRAAQIALREQVAPTAVPDRPGDVGPNIVAYALNAPNVLGQEWYSRSLLSGQARFRRNCAGYATADDAQRDFLARGGPERDRRGIDPDGDGFACDWDPAPFIQAVQN